MKQSFKTKLVARGPKKAWTFLHMPFDAKQVFGKAGMVAVRGTINGFEFRGTLTPEGNGSHEMVVNKQLQAGAKAKPGDTVAVVLDADTEPRTVEIPPDLKAELQKHSQAEAAFTALSYSHRKEFVQWIAGAKRPETRAARVAKTIPMTLEKRRPSD